ncbi:uncharacterized protein LOC112455017 [Temnothorax curvispinosus]|uniref:Uncharacterized protein LOC112452222 n=1 Tax=Temnothorax curvispinosus TaxID=300111 RepID=A0A6J1PRM7_9HYME|nr:uncharacterized protein LOC112452222 [Temnothorax curvispinosus]XP_024872457.1 uncharacterized protein LOC112455017 [Temnothorax curvispinosus]
MGNCLKRTAGNQLDNTTLLSNNPEPNVSASGSSQEGLGPPIPYNQAAHYQSIATRERHLQSTNLNIGHGIGVNLVQSTGSAGLSEEEQQVRIAKRITAKCHGALPTGRRSHGLASLAVVHWHQSRDPVSRTRE